MGRLMQREGIHNIQLGNAGDAHTKSYNLIRDTLFMGNDKLYHDVGNVFVTASAIMIPIGQDSERCQGLDPVCDRGKPVPIQQVRLPIMGPSS